jgi:tetratricopeptide (TPR) repeat protein
MNASRSLFALVFFACSEFSFAGIPALADGPSTYDRALALFNTKDYKGAIALIDPFLKANPTDARALVLRGDARASLNDDIGALRDYDAAIAANPQYQYAYATRCDTRRDESHLDAALDDCNRAISLDGTDPLAYEYRANVRFDLNQYAEAVSDYDPARAPYGDGLRRTLQCRAPRRTARARAGRLRACPDDRSAKSLGPLGARTSLPFGKTLRSRYRRSHGLHRSAAACVR